MWNEIQNALNLLDILIEENKHIGLKMSAAETKYYTVKDLRVRELMDEGKSATAIELIIKGEPKVNDALQEYRDSEVEYKNSLEAINACKLRIRVYEAQYEREWEQAKRGL